MGINKNQGQICWLVLQILVLAENIIYVSEELFERANRTIAECQTIFLTTLSEEIEL